MAAKDLYEKDYYQILGVAGNADAAAIKKQYRKLARELHPDKTKGDKKLEDRFKAVSEAYDILSDSKKRREYDDARQAFKSGRVPPGFNGGGQGFNGGDFSDLFGMSRAATAGRPRAINKLTRNRRPWSKSNAKSIEPFRRK